MASLLGLRDYDEKDVIGFYSFSGTHPCNKGTIVKVIGSGYVVDQDPSDMLGSVGASYNNTVSQRYGVHYRVGPAGTGDNALGMTLFDVKETDENGEQLKFNPRKAYEIEAVISGQNVPVVTRGRFLYSGITGAITPGQNLYVGAAGTIESVLASAQGVGGAPAATVLGKALGAKSAKGYVLVQLDF